MYRLLWCCVAFGVWSCVLCEHCWLWLFVVWCFVAVVRGMLFAGGRCVLFVACLMCLVRCTCCVARSVCFAVCSCWLLRAVWCLLFAAWCLFCYVLLVARWCVLCSAGCRDCCVLGARCVLAVVCCFVIAVCCKFVLVVYRWLLFVGWLLSVDCCLLCWRSLRAVCWLLFVVAGC